MPVKEMCIANPIVKGQYQTADNPIFEVFYLEDAHGLIADFSGNAPYKFLIIFSFGIFDPKVSILSTQKIFF